MICSCHNIFTSRKGDTSKAHTHQVGLLALELENRETMDNSNNNNTNTKRRIPTRHYSQLNNQGVQFLQEGHYEDATYCFIEAMQGINRQMVSPPVDLTSSISSESSDHSSYFISLDGQDDYYDDPCCTPHHPTTTRARPSHDAGSELFLFRSALLLLSGDHDEKGSDCCSTCCSNSSFTKSTFVTVLYNLALSYHLKALELNDIQSLTQALSYYQIAYRVVVSGATAPLPQVMAIFNNIGHVHRLLRNDDGAKNCFQHLLSVMMLVQQTGEVNRINKWDGFLSNVFGLIGEGPNPASAA